MNGPTRRDCLLSALLGATGCAAFATIPPTPARCLTGPELDAAEPGAAYYVAVFGSDACPKRPASSHTFATVARAVCLPGSGPAVEHHTISWLPRTLTLRVLCFTPEPGCNLGLHATVRWAVADGQCVALWGPYECRPAFYRRFLVQKRFLESGPVAYQAIDTVGREARRGGAANCIHALTDMDPDVGRGAYPLIRYGQAASRHFVRGLCERGVLVRPEVTHPWLEERLGLAGLPIERRS